MRIALEIDKRIQQFVGAFRHPATVYRLLLGSLLDNQVSGIHHLQFSQIIHISFIIRILTA